MPDHSTVWPLYIYFFEVVIILGVTVVW
jgi:hypothetical protein